MAALALGAACDADQACESGTCAEGVCCATACDGGCNRCDLKGQRGTCAPVAADTICGTGSCRAGSATPAPRCDGHGTCVAAGAESCGAYICEDETSCAEACTAPSNEPCSSGNVCARGVCAPASCSDGVRTAPETAVDCGGGACPRCAGDQACAADTDCESGMCTAATFTCTSATYAWRTTSFTACDADACSLGTQQRTVWCERSDGTHVDDVRCTEQRPTQSQSCQNTTACTWFAGGYGSCSVRCGGGSQTRPVFCSNTVGGQVPNAWCSGPMPGSSQGCNNFACVVHVVGEPSAQMGPCWSPPNCLGGYPAFPSCPSGYAPTRSEIACGNPNNCGSNWALCTFFQSVHYGCSNSSFVMGIAARECTYQ